MHVNATTAGFIYLVVVLFAAARWGLIEALIASLAGVLCFNFFFLPPVETFTIADPQNWVALAAFLVTAITASQLSAAAKRQASEAIARQRDMERLYSVSRSILLLDSFSPVERQLAAQIARTFSARGVMLYVRDSGKFHSAGPEDIDGVEENLREAAVRGTHFRDALRQLIVTAIRLGAEPIGSLALSGVEMSDSAQQGLASLIAIGIEQAKVQKQASEIEAARRSDELKSTLLDAIAHEFKTPLTSIKAAASSMLSDSISDPGQRKELLTVVDEETDRLSGLVTEAIEMARIERGKITLQRDWQSPEQLLRSAAEERRAALHHRPVQFDIPVDLPDVRVDSALLRLAIRQLIDNAIKYSPPGSPIEISAIREGGQILFRIRDYGPGIPESERRRIFERFYRAPVAKQSVPGAGLGLTIAENIAEAHGGAIRVISPDGPGALFLIALPFANAITKASGHKDNP